MRRRAAALLAVAGATGKADEVVKLPTARRDHRAAARRGRAGQARCDGAVPREQVRRASGAAARALAGTAHAVSTLGRDRPGRRRRGQPARRVRLHRVPHHRQRQGAAGGSARRRRVDADEARTAAAAVAEAVRTARDLVNTPPNDLYPETFAARAAALAEAAGLEVEVLDDAALADGGYGGVLGVGQGSSRKPRLVRLRWAGGPAPRATVALVGKGITFDTGGISIKPAAEHGPHDVATWAAPPP